MNTQQQVNRRYYIELFGSLAVYVVLLIAVNLIAGRIGTSNRPLLIALAVTPMIPVIFTVAAVVRYLSACDELERQIQLTSLAITVGATAFVTFTYGFLEGAGFPRLSMFSVWPLMAIAWLASSIALRLRYR